MILLGLGEIYGLCLFSMRILFMNKRIFLLTLTLLVHLRSCEQERNIDYYISAAFNNSPLLYELRNQLLMNSLDSQLLSASNKIQFKSNGDSYNAPIRNGYGYDEAITNRRQIQLLLTATQNLVPKKFIQLQFRDLQLAADSIKTLSRISERDLAKSVTDQYISAYADQVQVDFNNELLTMLHREEAVLKKLTRQNVYKQADYLAFLVTLQQQVLTGQQAEYQYHNNLAALNYLAGIADTSFPRLQAPDLPLLVNQLMDTTAFFMKYTIDSLRLANSKAMIGFDYRPHVSVYADGGFQSTLSFVPYRNFGTSYGISFTIPIYDGGQKKLRYAKIDLAEKARARNRDYFSRQYMLQAVQLRRQLFAIENLLAAIDKQIIYTRTLLEVNAKLLETGDIKMTDYVLALNNYITAKHLLMQNMISRYQVINQVNYWNK